MKITIHPIAVLRIPQFSVTDELTAVWEELKASIEYASIDFYEQIKDLSAKDLAGLDLKKQFTIWKYFNRSKYRGVPYGSFSGFAMAAINKFDDEVVLSKEQHLHRFKDWSLINDINPSDEELTSLNRLYLSNSSTYETTDHIRFLSLQEKIFELSEIEKSIFITELLSFCSIPVEYSVLKSFAMAKEVGEDVLIAILKAMMEMQLIFTDLHPNIIGTDYFEKRGLSAETARETYLIAERKVLSGGVNQANFQHLPSCINYLIGSIELPVNKDLNSFKKSFLRRFEQQEVPLMRSLDPELGVGYGDFESNTEELPLDHNFHGNVNSNENPSFTMSGFAYQLIQGVLNGAGSKAILQLADKQQSSDSTKGHPANSFSALVKIAGDLVVLDHLGGCTANALAGRFTMASEELLIHCKDIAARESMANPDVIFFDIAYTAEGRVDNINRRKTIFEYELPVLNYSCAPYPIQLNDILVTVRNNEIILISKKYGKRLIPRLATAYNYSRSDLSVYRFLCDLQHQNIYSRLSFDIQSIMPGLKFYPRIQYKNIVLSTAKWRVNAVEAKDKNLSDWLTLLGVSRYFSAGDGDQTLYFDRTEKEDMIFFNSYLKQYNDFVISEIIYTDKQIFRDVYKNNYFTQILLTLTHDELLYPACSPQFYDPKSWKNKEVVPGKDWLYFEVYCHAQRSNVILSKLISKFIAKHQAAFKTWFFVRYDDPLPHLRLRFQLQEKKDGYFYMSKLMELFSVMINDGMISDVQLKTYRPETLRYGPENMKNTEQHFKADSEYALKIMKAGLEAFDIYAQTMILMKHTMTDLDLDKKGQLLLVKEIESSFEVEHQMRSADFKVVNKEWVAFNRQYLSDQETKLLPAEVLRLKESFCALLENADAPGRSALFFSLFHMHVNRLFSSHQRTHEMIIYSFLCKQLQRELQQVKQEILQYSV